MYVLSCASATYFTASTGLAAVNISGQTLHSFAGVGLGEGDPRDLLQRVQVQQHARRRWESCKTLVIDEISMIDRGLFDKLEYIARTIRKNPLPFGGIQLILTGDFLQLPPVKNNGFVFESRSWSDCVPVTIELQSVFRQNDSSLVAILNSLRRGIVDKAVAAAMQSCVNRKFDTSDGIEATELYSMKKQVSEENDDRLAKLDTAEVEYTALDKGTATYLEQLTRSCNAAEKLVLKEGAQVMLLKNLTSALVNGSRGVVVSFDVQESDDMQPEHRRVAPTGRWPRVKFTNGSEMTMLPERWDVEVNHKSVASRTQVPLMLAWSLTVHKCQGMTLDRVSLHLGSIFEYGQAYVALSRIRSLCSLSIKDKFPQHVIKAHPKAIKFYDELHFKQNGHSNNALPAPVQPPAPLAPTFASRTPVDVPDPYEVDDGDADMAMSDELIAMAADEGNETTNFSSASPLPPSTFNERDKLLSPTAFSPASSSPFVRASSLSASQPVLSPSRHTIVQHFQAATSSTSTVLSAEMSFQPSTTAATVRRHQLLLKRKTQTHNAQTVTAPAAPVTSGTAAGEKSSSPSQSARDDEIDLVSDDDDSPSPHPVSARIEQPQWPARANSQQQHAGPTGTLLSTVAEKKLSPNTRTSAPSSEVCAAPPNPAQLALPDPSAVDPSAESADIAAESPADCARDNQPLPPLYTARCTPHDRPLHAQIDWNKENESIVRSTKPEHYEGALKREQSGGVQWLYRCEMGCMLVVRSTT